jgi:hypothetical protein
MLLAGSAAGQTFSVGPLLEISSSNALAHCTADAGQPGTSYLDSEVEPWVVINPVNPANLVAIWQQDRWSNGGARGLVTGVSTNGGGSWQLVPLPGLSPCTGGAFQRATDPWITFGPDGTLHAVSLAFDEDAPGANAMLAQRSTDGGFTWSAPVTLTFTNAPEVFNDKQTVTADPTDANYVYAVWDRLEPYRGDVNLFSGPTIFTRSTDGGVTWEPVRVIYATKKFQQTLGNQILVRPDGVLVNLATGIRALKTGKGRCQLLVQTSADKGVTWSKPRKALKLAPRSAFDAGQVGVFDPQTREALRTGDSIPAVAVHPVNGTLYAVWEESSFSDYGRNEIAFSQSVDGRKWSKPIKINQTPGKGPGANRQAFNPAVRVALDGTICVTYYDFRDNDQATPLPTDVWAVFCHPTPLAPATDPANWGGEVRLTDASFDFRQAPNARGFFVGDYQGLATDGMDFVACFGATGAAGPSSIFVRRLAAVPQ